MKNFLLLAIATIFCGIASAQVDIQIEIENYESDTLILAHYFADKILVTDTLYSDNQKDFRYQSDSTLAQGMYVMVARPSGEFYQLLLDEDQEFQVNINKDRADQLVFTGSAENSLFYEYMTNLNMSRAEIGRIDQALQSADSTMVSIVDQLQKDKETVNQTVVAYQNEIISKYGESITALLLKSNLPFEFPEFEGTQEEIDQQKYVYYKKRYFDNVPLADPRMLRTPVMHQRIEYYMNNLTPQQADSINTSLDYILAMLEPSEEAYQYYLSYYLGHYGNSKYIGMDAVYVHLALNYYDKGKAPWVSEENLGEIVGNAKKLAPTLIGKAAPDFEVFDQEGNAYTLEDFNKDFTIIVFWKPDCGHCTKAMPHIIDFNEKYKDKSVDILTVCTKTGKKYGECWEGVKEKNMETLLNTGDEYHRSRIFSKYYVNSTPSIYILDKDKKIKLKKVPAENLDAVMEQLMKIDESEGRMN